MPDRLMQGPFADQAGTKHLLSKHWALKPRQTTRRAELHVSCLLQRNLQASLVYGCTGQLCDICGDTGIAEAVVTCSRCNKFREHIYCMRNNLDTIPELWFCETCLCRNEDHQNICPSDCQGRNRVEEIHESTNRKVCSEVPDASKGMSSPSCKSAGRLLSRNFIPKKVETGKVKYLQIQEIYAISSGDRLKASFSQGVRSSRMMSFGGHRRPTAKRTSGAAPSSPKFTSKKDHAYNTSIGNPKPLTVSGVQTTSPRKQSAVNKVSQPLEKFPSTSPRKNLISGTPKSVAVFSRRKKHHIGDEVHHSPADRIRPMVHGMEEKSKRDSVPSKECVKEKPVNAIVSFDQDKLPLQFGKEDLPNPPAVRAAWKGRFEISDFLHETYDGFQAHPPEQVSKRAFLASKQMPGVLQFSLLPRNAVWPEIFRKESPSGFDIALYFWADNLCRSSEKYNILMQLMNEQDLSMQTHFDGVTLLIFSSNQLPVESQKMDKRNYLWGVFSSSKGQNSKGKQVAVDIPSPVPLKVVENPSFSHDDQAVDMEIDMVGGKEVGRIDKIVSKSISVRPQQLVQENTIAKQLSQESGAPPGFSRSSNVHAFKVTPLREQPHFANRLDPPPGFSRVPASAATKKIKAEFGTTY
ncbi:hypothetical protein ACHQM5_006585 [Ranunculus cassubicifolius]